jgi:hypothetical protein
MRIFLSLCSLFNSRCFQSSFSVASVSGESLSSTLKQSLFSSLSSESPVLALNCSIRFRFELMADTAISCLLSLSCLFFCTEAVIFFLKETFLLKLFESDSESELKSEPKEESELIAGQDNSGTEEGERGRLKYLFYTQ